MLRMTVHKINPNGVKFKINQGMVTISGPAADTLRGLKLGQTMGMELFIEEQEAPPLVQLSDSDPSPSESTSSSGPEKPLNGE